MSGRAIVLVASIGLLAASVASQFSPSSSAAEPVAGQSEAAPATQKERTAPPDDASRAKALLAEFRAAKPYRERHPPGAAAKSPRSQVDVGEDLIKLSRKAVPALIEALDDPEPQVAVVAALALGRIGDKRAIEPMLKILTSAIAAPTPETAAPAPGHYRVAACVCALGELREPRAVASIVALERMQTDRNDLIEQLGFKGHSWDYMCGIMPIVSGDAIDRMGTAAAPELAHLLADPDAKTRYAAAEFLSRFGVHDEKYIGGWLAQAEGFRSRREESVKDRDERKAAERAVSERVVALAGGKLIELLRDKDWKVRRQSVQTLGNLCVTSAVGPLIECLKDEDSDVGWDAVRALGQIGGPKALDALASLLENPGPGRIELAEEAAPIVGGPKAFAFWKTDLRSSAPPRRKAAFDGLRLLGTPEAVDLLIAGLKDDDSSVRFCAAEDLGRLRGPVAARGVEPLIAALRDGDDNLRVAAVRALGYIADRRAVDPLIAELKDSNWHVRGDALEALGRIKDPKSVAPVKAMLKDSDTYVRLEAVTSLAELQPPDLADTVRPMLADTDNIVRDAAARAISKAAKRAGGRADK